MKESQPGTTEITLPDTPALAFAALLKYMYTGRMNLTEIKVSHELTKQNKNSFVLCFLLENRLSLLGKN